MKIFTIIAYWVTLFPLEDQGIKKKTEMYTFLKNCFMFKVYHRYKELLNCTVYSFVWDLLIINGIYMYSPWLTVCFLIIIYITIVILHKKISPLSLLKLLYKPWSFSTLVMTLCLYVNTSGYTVHVSSVYSNWQSFNFRQSLVVAGFHVR